MLCSKPRELLHSVKVLKRVAESLCSLTHKNTLDSDLFLCLIADRVDVLFVHVVKTAVFVNELVDVSLAHLVHFRYEVAHSPGVHLPAELYLSLDLVALGDSYLTHIVTKAHYFQLPAECRTDSRALPVSYLLLSFAVLPVACNDTPRRSQPCADEAVLSVAVSRLVKVHIVHIYLLVGDRPVVLRVEMKPRLL